MVLLELLMEWWLEPLGDVGAIGAVGMVLLELWNGGWSRWVVLVLLELWD